MIKVIRIGCELDDITVKELEHSEMMDYIVDSLELVPELLADTVTCYEDENVIFQLCYINDDNSPHKTLNKYATELVYDKIEIHGPAVLLCSYIKPDLTCYPASVSRDELDKLYNYRTNHVGLHVNEDGSLVEYKFTTDPLYDLSESEKSEYGWFEHNLLTFNLVVYMKKKHMGELINKKITKLLGSYRIHGPVRLVLKKYSCDYENMSELLFEKLLLVSGGSLDNRKLSEYENRDNDCINGLYTVNNSCLILRDRLASHKNVCNYCLGDLVNNHYTCTGCYRMYYHSEECQSNHWSIHKNECLHNLKPLEHI